MKVAHKRWGEVSIKKQGQKKNDFDKTKSFSIMENKFKYDIDQLKDVYELVTNLTQKHKYKDLIKKLKR